MQEVITLTDIKAAQARVNDMIAAFEAQTRSAIHLPEQIIDLAAGEHYAGIIVGKDGNPSYHLILLPGQAESVDWEDAKTWAKGVSGELPNRREQSLLYANLKEEFDPNWYWSSEAYASSGYAWDQYFRTGGQSFSDTINELRARAVRRLVIE